MTDKPDKAGPVRHWGAGRVVFLTILETVRRDVKQGYPLTVIYRRHAAKLGVSYASFARYVQRYITQADNRESRRRAAKRDAALPSSQAAPSPSPSPSQPSAKPSEPGGGPMIRQFKYDPRGYGDDDLY